MKRQLSLLLFCLSMLACSGEKTPEQSGVASGTTPVGNFDYIFLVRNNGPTPQPGDSVFFHFDIKKAGELVTSSRTLGKPHVIEFPLQYSGIPQPLIEGLRLMSPGDSLYIEMLMNNDRTQIVSYDLKLERIQPKVKQ